MADSPGAIDSLSIEISATSKSAADHVNALADSMEKLKTAANGLSLGNFKTQLSGIGDNEYTKIEKLAQALQGLKGISLNAKIGDSMLKIADACDLIDQQHIAKLENFGRAMQNLKGVSIRNYDTLPASILNIAAAVDSITDDSILRIHRLTMALGRLKGVDLKGVGQVLKAQNDARKLEMKSAGKAASGRKKSDTATQAMSANQMAEEIWNALDSSDSKFKKFLDSLLKIQEAVDGIGKRFKEIDWSFSGKKNIEQIKKAFIDTGKAIEASVHPAVRVTVSLIAEAVKGALKLAKAIAKIGLNLLKSAFNGIKKAISGAADAAKKLMKAWYDSSAIKKVQEDFAKIKSLISSIGRVALYRAVRSVIKYVTDAVKEGSKNAYYYAKQFGDATRYIADSLDRLATSQFKMKNQVGAAWDTLLATVEPILTRLLQLFTKGTEIVTQFFAVLSGSGTYLKAVDYAKEWAEETEQGAAAAKEWKNQLMGFDEINRLEEPSNSGRGSGKTGEDYGRMFEEAKVGSWFEDLKKMLDSNEWAAAGRKLASNLNSLVNNFDWAGWGRKIGQKIQNAIEIAFGFLKKFNFRELGSRLMESIDSLADQIDFTKLGALTTRLRTAIWDVLYGAFTRPGSMGRLATNLSNYILGALNEFADWLESLDPQAIATAISDFFGNLKYAEIKNAMVRVIQNAWNLLINTKDLFLLSETGQTITNALSDYFGGLTWDKIKETIQTKVSNAWNWALERLDDIWPEDKRNEFMEQAADKFVEIGWSMGSNLAHSIGKKFEEVWNQSTAGKIWNAISWIAKPEVQAFKAVKKQFKDNGEDSSGSFLDGIKAFLTGNSNKAVIEFEDVGADCADGFGTGFEDQMKNATDHTLVIVFDDFTAAAEDALKCHSPSKVFEEIGKNTGLGFFNGLRNEFRNIYSMVRSKLNEMKQLFNVEWSFPRIKMPHFSWTWQSIGGLVSIPRITVEWYKNGGFPEDGLFMANHGELVGKFSNGKTAVANNEQITEGIAQAVYGAFLRAFSETGGNNGGGTHVAILQVNGREFARATYDDQRAVEKEKGVSLIANFA